MDDGIRTLLRLERIEQLEREGAPARLLLDELRALVGEAETWAAGEGDPRALRAARRCRSAVEGRQAPM